MKRAGTTGVLLGLMIGMASVAYSCKGEQQEVAHEAMEQTRSMRFTVKPVSLPSFDQGTAGLLASWPVFQDFQREVGDINGKTLSELRNKTRRLLTYTDSLGRSVPDSLRVQPIVSRIVVLNSRVQLLDQQVRKDRIDSATVAEDLTALMQATARFYDQINQKLLKDAIDLQRREDEQSELEKQQRFLDSVHTEELKDKNRQKL